MRQTSFIRTKAGTSEIVVTTTSRLAGAVHSLTWNGVEFIDSTDHGRQLQSACAFDCGKKPFWAEAYNPTEAGSRKDHVGNTSSSRLIALSKTATTLTTKTQMAFWLNPGEVSKDAAKKALEELDEDGDRAIHISEVMAYEGGAPLLEPRP